MNRFILTSSLLFLIVLLSCKKDGRTPLVTTLRPFESGAQEATCGGVVYAEGDDAISARGICWSTHRDPTLSDNKTSNGTSTGNFTSKMTGIKPSTLYYVRAYATNKYGTSYGSEESLLTAEGAPPPVVFGKSTYSVTINTAVSGGSVLTGGGQAPVIKAGVCWSKDSVPTTGNSFATGSVSPIGEFTCNLSGLSGNTSYTVRAFATNSTGTSYGPPQIMKTRYGSLTDIDNNTYYTVLIGNQEWMCENLRVTKYRDGTPIPYVSDYTQWTQTPVSGAYCYPDNLPANSKFGMLYSWKAITNTSMIAPPGWHVPTQADYSLMFNALGGAYYAGQKLKSNMQGFWQDYALYTNSSGFTALPAGQRSYSGYFTAPYNNSAFFWTSTSLNSASVYAMVLDYTMPAYILSSNIDGGYSLRLIKD